MKFIVLGSGTCVPSLKRNAPGYYLEAEGCKVLVDCGSGTLLQLEKAGISYKDIDAVFITHTHPDHFADLMPLIQALLATPQFTREKDLSLFCPGDFAVYYKKAVASVLGNPQGFSVVVEDALDNVQFGPFHVTTAKTVHGAGSIAYRFECGGRSIVYTGDADYGQDVIDLAHGGDLLIADCSFPDELKVKGHLSAKECGIAAKEAGVKKLVLSHIYPTGSPDSDRVGESRAEFDGPVVLAEDLMEFNV